VYEYDEALSPFFLFLFLFLLLLPSHADSEPRFLSFFLSPAAGSRLVDSIISEATALGYQRMLLDTLVRLESANRVYEKKGFKLRSAYYHNPLDNVLFFEKKLG